MATIWTATEELPSLLIHHGTTKTKLLLIFRISSILSSLEADRDDMDGDIEPLRDTELLGDEYDAMSILGATAAARWSTAASR